LQIAVIEEEKIEEIEGRVELGKKKVGEGEKRG
jgi:hypothetical protein